MRSAARPPPPVAVHAVAVLAVGHLHEVPALVRTLRRTLRLVTRWDSWNRLPLLGQILLVWGLCSLLILLGSIVSLLFLVPIAAR